MKRYIIFILLSVPVILHASEWSYYFTQPATIWEESLPLGNGRIGLMPYGGIAQDRIVLNEISLWSGSVQDADNENAYPYLKQIQALLFDKKNKEAQDLMYKTFTCKGQGSDGKKYGNFQNFGNLYLNFSYPNDSAVSNYRRTLDLGQATATTTFTKGQVHYTRTYFASYTADVGVIKLAADAQKAISCKLYLQRDEQFVLTQKGHMLVLKGQLCSGKNTGGMRYYGGIKIRTKGGKTIYTPQYIEIIDADEAELFISMETNYKNPNMEKIVAKKLTQAMKKSYETIEKEHQTSFGELFNRVQIDLPQNINSELPIDKRLEAFVSDYSDANLAALYMQYGRYLLISSTRTGGLPPNLQGLWAHQIHTPWNGDYHLNINLQMNLWPAETGNLSELQIPLSEYIASLVESGKKTAKTYYNSRGWVTHILGNVWNFTSPGQDPSWGATNTANAWLCQHIWNHYLYTQDVDYLRRYYPVMKEAAQFFSDMLIKDPKSGFLITAPTTSPENSYYDANRNIISICAGSTMDNQLVRELFNNTIAASELLKTDTILRQTLLNKVEQLPPTKIGSRGQIMEWMEDYDEVDKHHRHVSQLYGLHPGNEITYTKTPKLMEAARTTLEQRGDESTGWSMAWKINFWARLKDGDRAYKLFQNLLTPAENHHGTYPNLFSAHPPMQIDGNFGGSAGIMEMLLQSHEGHIELLPALPEAWDRGSVSGLKVRGGGIVGIKWDEQKVTDVTLKATVEQTFLLKLPQDRNKIITDKAYSMQDGMLMITLQQGETALFSFQ